MWQATGKTRFKKVWLQDGILKADGADGVLWPFSELDLPSEFARVTDPRSALRFERRYSSLGYDSLVINPDERRGGDPLEWVLEQAKFVRLALELMYALAYQDGNNALRQFRYLNLKMIDDIHPAVRGCATLTYPAGAYNNETMIAVPRSEGEALWSAPSLIEIFVNANTRDIHQELVAGHNNELGSVLFCNTLIEAIWSMAGNIAVKTAGEGDYFRRCEWCNTPFLATDKRQKFCPTPEGLSGKRKQSLCGLQYRQHKLQTKTGKGGKN